MIYRPLGIFIGVLSLSLAAACGVGSEPSDPAAGSPSAAEATSPAGAASPDPTGDSAPPGEAQGPVAIVNGEEVSRAEFDQQLIQAEASYAQQGVPFPEGEDLRRLQEQIVVRLVQQTLVLQETESRGFTAEDEEIESRYQETLASFPDEDTFLQALDASGLSQEDVEGILEDNIKVEKLLDSVIADAALEDPTEDELRALYEQISQQQELPPFEEVRAQLEAELRTQQEDEVLQAFIAELEAASTVEILLGS